MSDDLKMQLWFFGVLAVSAIAGMVIVAALFPDEPLPERRRAPPVIVLRLSPELAAALSKANPSFDS